jgi:excisionase family DNA binding protein
VNGRSSSAARQRAASAQRRFASRLGKLSSDVATAARAARALGRSASFVRSWASRGLIPSVKLGRSYRIDLTKIRGVDAADIARLARNDADCTRAYLGNSCFGDGSSGVAVTQAGAAAIAAELKALQDQDCDATFKAGCVGPGTVNCPEEGGVGCVVGQCQVVWPIPGP